MFADGAGMIVQEATGATGDYKFWGAAAVGTKVYFAPWNQANVGIFDSGQSTFAVQEATGATGTSKFRGAAAVGTKVYFAPFNEANIGIFSTGPFLCSTIRGPPLCIITIRGPPLHSTVRGPFMYNAIGGPLPVAHVWALLSNGRVAACLPLCKHPLVMLMW